MEESIHAFDWLSYAFNFFRSTSIAGVSLLNWCVVVLVISIAGYLIKGNH